MRTSGSHLLLLFAAPLRLPLELALVLLMMVVVAPPCCRVAGHALWMHPAPRYDGDDKLKAWPCGTGNQYNNFTSDTPWTTLSPGPALLSFRETINHNGSPYRVALTYGNDDRYDELVLLDHLPHNDQGTVDEHPATGPKKGKWHNFTVTIPDVSCTAASNCSLQLIQVMTDKISPCSPANMKTSCGSPAYVYFSCANVIITGTRSPASVAPLYLSYQGNTAPTDYLAGEKSALWAWDAGNSGYWVFPAASPAPSPSPSPSPAPPSPSPPAPTPAPPPSPPSPPSPTPGGGGSSPDTTTTNSKLAMGLGIGGAALVLVLAGVACFIGRKRALEAQANASGGGKTEMLLN